MEAQGLFVARLFSWTALAVAVPSMVGTLYFGGCALLMWMQKPVVNSSVDAKVSDSLVNVVVQLAGFAGKVLTVFGGLVEGIIRGLALASFSCLVFAGMLYLTGRGLAGNALWAKVVGSGLMLVMMIVAGFGSLMSEFGPYRLVPLMFLVLGMYSLWMIWRGVA
jgi:hypothetical protein